MNMIQSISSTLLLLAGISSNLIFAADNAAPAINISGTAFTAVTNVPFVLPFTWSDDGLPQGVLRPVASPQVVKIGNQYIQTPLSMSSAGVKEAADGSLTQKLALRGTFKFPGQYKVSLMCTDGKLSATPVLITINVTDSAPAPFKAAIDFTPAGTQPVAGWTADNGAVYGAKGNGLKFGWNANVSVEAIDRVASPSYQLNANPVFNNFIRMQQSVANATWEIAVPNATYDVRLVLGDPANYFGNLAVNVENAPTVSFKPMAPNHWRDVVVSAQVTDGRLTIAPAPGSVNAKICAVEIQQVVSSTN